MLKLQYFDDTFQRKIDKMKNIMEQYENGDFGKNLENIKTKTGTPFAMEK